MEKLFLTRVKYIDCKKYIAIKSICNSSKLIKNNIKTIHINIVLIH